MKASGVGSRRGSANSPAMQEFLSQEIQKSLDALDYDNAKYLAEVLQREFPTTENLLQVANVYFRWGKPQRAYYVLQDTVRKLTIGGSWRNLHPTLRDDFRFTFANICFKLRKFQQAEDVLMLHRNGQNLSPPKGAAGWHLLGRIARAMQNRDRAIKYFRKALELNSFQWSSYEQLCQLGETADPNEYFMVPGESSTGSGDNMTLGQDNKNDAAVPDLHSMEGQCVTTVGQEPQTVLLNQPSPTVSFHNMQGLDGHTTAGFTLVNAADVSTQPHQLSFSSHAGTMSPDVINGPTMPSLNLDAPITYPLHDPYTQHLQTSDTPIGITNRGPRPTHAAPTENLRLNNKRKSPRDTSDDYNTRGAGRKRCKTAAQDESKCSELFRRLARGYMLLCQYSCKEALLEFGSLPQAHQTSGWVLAQMGRAQYELARYPKAIGHFNMMRQQCPWRLEGLEILSTALWHVKRNMELSYLAGVVKEQDLESPEAWIAMGNCFSIQQDTEKAIQCFKKAYTLKPSQAYAYTLCAHEYLSNEDYEQAEKHYRRAIRIDERHYNAWYGLGNIHMHREKLDLAIYHFRRALGINPRSPVLHTCMGMTLRQDGKPKDAIKSFDAALRYRPSNPLALYQKAQVLMEMHDYGNAVTVLQATTHCAPMESAAHVTLGKAYKKLGRVTDALNSFSLALNLNPKDKNSINHAMSHVHDNDSDDEDDGDF